MFQSVDGMRAVGRIRELPARFTAEEASRLALARVRKVLTAWLPGMVFDPARLREQLSPALGSGAEETERLHCLGWLHWLSEDLFTAETMLDDAYQRSRRANNLELLAPSGYWLARVRQLLGKPDPVAEYETILRTLKGSAQGTAWFVDLLWRAGRVDRADQVWKTVRPNKKVLACDEGPLLEARAMLRRGELQPAEKVLNEAAPGSGVVQVERLLLQAWLAVGLKQPQRVEDLLKQAQKGPYPASALVRWRTLLEWRVKGTDPIEHAKLLSPLLGDLIRGQQARLAGKIDEAVAALMKARPAPAFEPFARYALACLGQDDAGAVLAGQPGLFLGLRCRARQAIDRFRNRQAAPAELLDALQQAGSVHFRDAAAAHFQKLAVLLQRREPQVEELRSVVSAAAPDAAQRRNLFRAALEALLQRLHPETQRTLLVEWAQLPWLANEADAACRALLARPLLCLVLRERRRDGPERATLDRLQPGQPLLQLLVDESVTKAGTSAPLVLWQAARQLTATGLADSTAAESWRQRVRTGGQGRWRGLAQVLLVQEAARRGDVAAVTTLLDDVEAWRGFRPAPPRGLLHTLVSLAAAQPGHSAWKRSLPGWLKLWDLDVLGADGKVLAAQAGLTTASGSRAEPPPGMPVVPWFLHQATRAQGRGAAVEALACIRRALAADPEGNILARAVVVREALPELERRAHAAALADAVGPVNDGGATSPSLLVDVVDLIRGLPEGNALLHSLQPGLVNLVERADLPARLVHHLALLQLRAAQWVEEHDQTDQAEPYWRRSWQLWLRWLNAPGTAQEAPAETTAALLDFLLGLHRTRVNDLLARNEVDRARRHWNLVQELPGQAGRLAQDLADRVARFRDELASEYLVTTREAMRFGDIAEGMHADYDKGLTFLRRLLSLDRDSVRLLTALVEVCGEYFLDLYHAGSPAQLVEQVERFLPFALQLIRLIENQPGALAARAVLAEYWKFRGFIARDREQKKNFYRDALRYNPANENVRKLLHDLENPADEE